MDNGFARELALWGPESSQAPFTLKNAEAYCRRLAHVHYENFSVASLLLPRRLLPHFHAIYAYCRWADDLGDETGGGERALGLLQWWREQLTQCYQGTPRHPVMIALRKTIGRYRIPPAPFLDLIRAFEQDQRITRYQTYDQLTDYCRLSANSVGHLVLYLCECFNAPNAAHADKVCTGLQLANFWQDVRRDLDIGRVYLPEEDMRRFEYAEADLHARRYTPAFRDMMRFQVARTRLLFEQGQPLVRLVPNDVQADIELFIRGGLGILDKIAAIDYNVWHQRPVLKKWEKAALVGGVLWKRIWSILDLRF
jgi:squalene synthase HpnC